MLNLNIKSSSFYYRIYIWFIMIENYYIIFDILLYILCSACFRISKMLSPFLYIKTKATIEIVENIVALVYKVLPALFYSAETCNIVISNELWGCSCCLRTCCQNGWRPHCEDSSVQIPSRLGEQKLLYKDVIKCHLKEMDNNVESWEDIVVHRSTWRSILVRRQAA